MKLYSYFISDFPSGDSPQLQTYNLNDKYLMVALTLF